MENPFEEESPDLYSLDTKDVVESKGFDVRKDNVIGIIIKGPTLSRLFRID
jgi:hypothetical protein